MLDEEAKAVQEVAKTTGKALDILKDILGESFRQFGGTIADWAKYYRYLNFLRITDKVAEIHASRHLAGKPVPVPPQYILPLIEGASLENEESIQSLWAGLIANATDPTRKFNLKKVYIEILRALEPLDAMVLELLANQEIQETYGRGKKPNLNTNEVAQLLGEDIENVKNSLHTLDRYNCIVDVPKAESGPINLNASRGFNVNMKQSNFMLSHLGMQLVQAITTK